MGRGKLNMKLISNEKARNATFKKRKTGLRKKIYELSTLCGVDVCMVGYGPQQGEHPVEPEIYPDDPVKVRQIIERYQQINVDDRRRRAVDLSKIFEDRKRKVEEELVKLRRKNDEILNTGWDDRMNEMLEDELREIFDTLGSKTEELELKIKMLKGKQSMMEGAGMIDCYTQALMDQNPCNYTQPQPLHMMKPLDHHNLMVPMGYPSDPVIFCGPSDPTMFCGSSNPRILQGGSSMNPAMTSLNNNYNYYDSYSMGPIPNQFYHPSAKPEMDFGNREGLSMFHSSPFTQSISSPYFMPGTRLSDALTCELF